jgi:predicted nucleic acid-binding protein
MVFRDRTGQVRQNLEALIADRTVFLTRFTQLELLQGSLDEREWNLLSSYLVNQDYSDISNAGWISAARVYYDLRRRGLTVRSPIDCCIAQVALDNEFLLIHNDRDFEAIAQVRELQHFRFLG